MSKKVAPLVRLLLADSSLDFGERVQSHLRSVGINARVQRVAEREALAQAIAAAEADLVLIDWDSTIAKPAEVIALIERTRVDLPVIAMLTDVSASTLLALAKARVATFFLREEPEHAEDAIRREWQRRDERQRLAASDAVIRELEQRCDALLESSRDAIAYVHEGMHVRANQAYLDLFGVSGFDELEGSSLLDMLAGDSAARLKEVMRRVVKDTDPFDPLDLAASRVDGRRFEAEAEFARATFEGEPCLQITLRERASVVAGDTDALTGLKNRQAVFKLAEDAVAAIAAGRRDSALLLVEPDSFDRIADALGVAQADEVIRQIAAGMKGFAQSNETVARYTDHGFVLLIEKAGHETAQARAEQLRHAFAGHVFEHRNRSFPITISGGLVLIGSGIASSDDLLSSATRTLKQAQEAGGNRIAIFDPAAQEKADAATEQAMVALIKDALRNDDFALLFQPVVSLQGADGEFYQVLLRLHGPEGEMLPTRFFPLAEKYGLLASIDRWVVAHACESIAARVKEGRPSTLFVKLNARSLDEKTLVPWITQQVKHFRVPGASLVFELTEGAVSTNLNGVRQFRDLLAPLGCKLAIQDFGQAANAQQILELVHADFLKLDRNLMVDLPKSSEHQNKLRALCEVVHSARKSAVAQFVEDAASMSVLFTMGVDFVQGNFLQEPEKVVSAA